MGKYLYTARDIGIFLHNADLPHSIENKILENLWMERKAELELKYRKNQVLFYKSVNREIEKLLLKADNHEMDSINKILEDIGSNFIINHSETEEYAVEAFFKVNKLRLTYIEDMNEIRMKLRTLLRYFGYKRRSPQLVSNVKRTLHSLGLKTYLRGYELCDVATVNIDDMVMIRLKKKGESES